MIRCFTLCFLLFGYAFGQTPLPPTLLTALDASVAESSGLAYFGGRIITHNDSGDGPHLYEIDSANGNILRTVVVTNASANDWEDLAQDSSYLYIADFGNNNGTRTDLKIFRISWNDYLAQDSVEADTIAFSYADQTDFSSQTFQTDFDAEALIAFGDSLYIFTKNWGSLFTSGIYPCPKLPGTYSLNRQDSLNVPGLVTGADYDPVRQSIWLTGYFLTTRFLVQLPGVQGLPFSASNDSWYDLNQNIQVEAICHMSNDQWLISNEADNATPDANLWRFQAPLPLGRVPVISDEIIVYPQPASGVVQVEWPGHQIESITWHTVSGKVIAQSGARVNADAWPAGLYFGHVWDSQLKTRALIRVHIF